MNRSFLIALAALLLPTMAFAQATGETEMKPYVFEPDSMMSLLGIIYTIAMVGLFLYVGWISKKRVASSEDYFAAGRKVGGLSNGLAMTLRAPSRETK